MVTFETPSASAAFETLPCERSMACRMARFSISASGTSGCSMPGDVSARHSPVDATLDVRKRPTRRVASRSSTSMSAAARLTSASMTLASSRMLPGQS
jgi:hypothetical protein